MKLLRALTPEESEEFLALSVDPDMVADDCGNQGPYYGVAGNPDVNDRVKRLNEILRESIGGFGQFCNFQTDGIMRATYDYGYDDPTSIQFYGIGYIDVADVVRGHFAQKD